MKLSTKMLCGFMLIGALILVQSFTSYQGFRFMSNCLDQSIKSSTLIDAAMEMKYAAARDMQIIMELIASESQDELNKFWNEHLSLSQDFDRFGHAIIHGAETEEGTIYATSDEQLKKIVIEAESLHNEKFLPPIANIYALKKQALSGTAIVTEKLSLADEQADQMGNTILSQLGEIENEARAIISQAKNDAFHSMTRGYKILMTSTGLGLLLAGVLGMTLSAMVTRPVAKAVAFTQLIADGDLTQQLDVRRKDEIGQMARALNQMVAKLSAILGEIIQNADRLNISSGDMAAVSKQLSTAAVDTSAKSAIVAAAAEEMSVNVQATAKTMEQSSANVTMVAASSEEMTVTIKEIAQNAERARSDSEGAVNKAKHASDQMNVLGSSAHKISRITETITEISDQTNLLALNATIEAARAGQAGRGFAVVANEIKELARQTALATIDIENQIDEMQEITTTAVNDIEQVTQLIVEIDSVINGIASAVEEQATASSEIAGNISLASQGIGEVNENVTESSIAVGEITREIAAINLQSAQVGDGSQQVQENAQELASLAGRLNQLAQQFKIGPLEPLSPSMQPDQAFDTPYQLQQPKLIRTLS